MAVFYIRASELPSRPNEYPTNSTNLDNYNHKMQRGELAPGSAVKRIEGGDTMSFLAWPKTRWFSEPEPFERENKLLDEFIEKHGEQLIDGPLKRAFFQPVAHIVSDAPAARPVFKKKIFDGLRGQKYGARAARAGVESAEMSEEIDNKAARLRSNKARD